MCSAACTFQLIGQQQPDSSPIRLAHASVLTNQQQATRKTKTCLVMIYRVKLKIISLAIKSVLGNSI